jgi:hypothetical protein
MSKDYTPTATFKKSARIISDYANDLIFEQPRDNLFLQEFISYEQCDAGSVKRTTVKRKFDGIGGYNDMSTVEII